MNRKLVVPLAGIALGLALVPAAHWLIDSRVVLPQPRDRAVDIARILSAHFATTSALKVATLAGDVRTIAYDERLGGLLRSRQATRFPYTVDYFVDLSHLSPADYRWDPASHILTVRIDDVTVARPNIDASRSASDRAGIFITRAAFDALAHDVAAKAIDLSVTEAKKPAYLDQARNSARVKIAALASSPLIAAGLGDVKVKVRFPWEAANADRAVPLDRSRSVGELYNKAN